MAPVRAAIDKILSGHAPYPAIVVDHRWDLVSANEAALSLLTEGVNPALLGERGNALRISLHPNGLASRIVNLAEWSSHLLDRLRREVAVSADPALDQLIAELRTYPDVVDGPLPHDGPAPLFVPLQLRAGATTLSFVSTVATFGTARDITAAELSIESFFPADEATASFLLSR
jgi:hypothetical protein